ncbi:MAG: M20/M25/M40 family metallo-hydrolase, partial [Candidatus Aphodomorpha sp.]
EELTCDTGYPAERVRELVSVGDTITFAPLRPLKLQNELVASKTMDDRALVSCMCDAMEMLQSRRLHCTVVFCATVQEEVGCYGAAAAGYHVNPDIAIAMDVSHAPTPDAPTYRTTPIDKVCMTRGGNIHPGVFQMLSDAAKRCNIPFEPTVVLGGTGTDARALQLQQNGVPTGLLELPLKYMHTSVEVGSLETLHNCAKILTECFAAIGDGWEDALCWND